MEKSDKNLKWRLSSRSTLEMELLREFREYEKRLKIGNSKIFQSPMLNKNGMCFWQISRPLFKWGRLDWKLSFGTALCCRFKAVSFADSKLSASLVANSALCSKPRNEKASWTVRLFKVFGWRPVKVCPPTCVGDANFESNDNCKLQSATHDIEGDAY